MRKSDDLFTEIKFAQQQTIQYLQNHWRLFLAEGIFFIVLGIAAIVIPQIFSVAIMIFWGWLIFLGGAFHLGRALFISNIPGFGFWLGLGVLQLVVGYLLIGNPMAGVITLTMMMTLFFATEGIIKLYLAYQIRPLQPWGVLLFGGLTALVFAFTILVFWTEAEYWVLGLFIGINMLILGSSMIKMSLAHKPKN